MYRYDNYGNTYGDLANNILANNILANNILVMRFNLFVTVFIRMAVLVAERFIMGNNR